MAAIEALVKILLELVEPGGAGLAADIDGTISRIAPTPAAASVSQPVRQALADLNSSGRYSVIAVVSGRAAAEARQMVGLDGLVYIGNHGMEVLNPGSLVARPVEAAAAFQPVITSTLETIRYRLQQSRPPEPATPDWTDGLLFEDKGVTASIHYRLCADPDLAYRLLLPEVLNAARPAGLRVSEGRMVLELRPPVDINKGTALKVLVEVFKLKSLVYLGDDLTDVDGFRAIKELELAGLRGVAIGVGSPEMPEAVRTAADYLVNGVAGVEELLERLAAELPPAARLSDKNNVRGELDAE